MKALTVTELYDTACRCPVCQPVLAVSSIYACEDCGEDLCRDRRGRLYCPDCKVAA